MRFWGNDLIIFRYLSKDILITTFAVTLILFLIFFVGKFVGLLADAVAGKYSVDVLFTIISYRMPNIMQMILPLGFYIAILLAYGRLYMDSEMVVLFAGGMSPRQLVVLTLVPALAVASLVALFSFWLSPLGAELDAKVLDEQRNRSEFETLNAGRFQSLGQGKIMTYVDKISSDRKRLENVFISRDYSHKTSSMIAVSEYGEQLQHPDYGQRYLVLHNGYRYEGTPGTLNFRVTKFSTYGQYLQPVELSSDYTNTTDAKPTMELLSSRDPVFMAALQWRLAFPILVFVAALMAVPLSKTNPRQGRYLKMLPAILLFVFYYTFLSGARGAMESAKWPIFPGLWIIHLLFFVLALLLLNWDNLNLKRAQKIAEKAAHA
jgi:lipopolysaccharide export system permease protein